MTEYVTRGRHPADPTGAFMGDQHWPLPYQYESAPRMYVAIALDTLEVLGVGEYRVLWAHSTSLRKPHRFLIGLVKSTMTYDALTDDQLRQFTGVWCSREENLLQAKNKVKEIAPMETPAQLFRNKGFTGVSSLGGGKPWEAQRKPVERPEKPVSTEPLVRPKAGTSTGQVWDIADKVAEGGAEGKVLRQQIIDACVAAGINQSTAGVQYSKWRRFKDQ